MPVPVPELAAWVVPTTLAVLAVLLSVVLATLVRRRRLAEVLDLDEVEDAASTTPTDGRDVRVLQRQVEVLTSTLQQWDQERQPAPEPTPGPAPTSWDPHPVETSPQSFHSSDHQSDPVRVPTPVPAPAASVAATLTEPADAPVEPVVPVPAGAPAYASLSRRLADAGDEHGAVLAQWVADLQVLRPALGDHGAELATAVATAHHADPVAALRACRESALGLVRAAGPVRALLAPLDHLDHLAPAEAVPTTLPSPLVDLLPPDQRERLVGAGMTAEVPA